MFRFANPDYLYFFVAIPFLILLFCHALYSRKKKLERIGDISLLKGLMPDVSLAHRIIKFVLCLLALSCLILALSRPQIGTNVETKQRTGIELVIAMDISNSMLATDVSPNRLEKAKQLVSNMADKLSDDKIALVVFAGQAFIQLPITSDFVSAKMFLDAIAPSMLQAQGTNIGEAVRLSMASFTGQKNVQRAIVLITDGEDQVDGADEVVSDAAKKGVHVYVLGIGSPKGATIPIQQGNYLRDKNGNIVVTKLNEDMCSKIAAAGRGTYIHVDNSNIAQERLYYELNKLGKTSLGTTAYSDYAEQFQLFAMFALLLLLADVLILEKKYTLFRHIHFFRNKNHLFIILLLIGSVNPFIAFAQGLDKIYMHKGNKAFEQKKYADAETYYRKSVEQNSQNSRSKYNLGNALLYQQKAKEAMKEYEEAASLEKNPQFKAAIYHNMGVILQSQKQFAPAAECYKESLRNNPKDDETRYNLALCLKQMKKEKKQNKEQNKEKKDDKQKEKNKQQSAPQKQQKQNGQRDQKNEMSKDNADQLLRAAQMKENRTQEKVRKSQIRVKQQQMEKNW